MRYITDVEFFCRRGQFVTVFKALELVGFCLTQILKADFATIMVQGSEHKYVELSLAAHFAAICCNKH